MDPITAIILSGLLATMFARTAGAAVTDAIAQAKGKTPPSVEKWRKRQADRAKRGEVPEKQPGRVRLWWRNAGEEHAAKAAQKHQARMERLAETAPENVAKHKAKLAKRAARRDKVNDTMARWAGVSWDAAKKTAATAAAKAKDAVDHVKDANAERRAWKENERRSADPDQTDTGNPDDTAEPTDTADGPADGLDAAVLPFRRPTEPDSDAPDTTPPTDCLDTTTTEGNPLVSTPQNTATDITDLDTAISYSQETVRYVDTVAGTLADMLAQLSAAKQGLDAEAAAYEQAKASLQDEGFKGKVTEKFDTAAEALHTAAEALRVAADQVSAASEQAAVAGGEMRGAIAVFSEQLAVSETVGAAAQDAGVSKRTDFYAPA